MPRNTSYVFVALKKLLRGMVKHIPNSFIVGITVSWIRRILSALTVEIKVI